MTDLIRLLCGVAFAAFLAEPIELFSQNCPYFIDADCGLPECAAYLPSAGNDTITVCVGAQINLSVSNLPEPLSGTVCATISEGNSGVITAPPGAVFTSVVFASYGTPNGSCGSFTYSGCHAGNSQSIVAANAIGQNSASLSALNDIFGDPCGGIYKRLYVELYYSSPGPAYDISWNTGESGTSIVAAPIADTWYAFSFVNEDLDLCSDSIFLALSQPDFSFDPAVISVCYPAEIELVGPGGFQSYSWNTGETTPDILVYSAGLYSLSVTDEWGCTASSEITLSMPDAGIPEDILGVCLGNSALLNAALFASPQPGYPVSYQWSTGGTSTQESIAPLGDALIYFSATDGLSSCVDSVFIDVTAPFIELGPDTLYLCGQEGPTLDAGPGFATYQWSTGASSQTIGNLTSGHYAVTGMDAYGCLASDDAELVVLGNGINQNDTTICIGESVYLDVSNLPESNISGTMCGVAGEGGSVTLTAPGQAVFSGVLFASYGTPNGNCGSFSTSGCHAASSLSVVSAQCIGQSTCTISATNGVFGDPCGGIAKQLKIELAYQYEQQAAEIFWSTGAVTEWISITPASDTTISLEIIHPSLTCIDEVNIAVNDPQLELAVDTIALCGADSTLLSSPEGYTSYFWSNGGTEPSVWAEASGTYVLTVSDEAGCQVSDSIKVSLINAWIEPGDTTICIGDQLGLDVISGESQLSPFYFNDFESGPGAGWSAGNTIIFDGDRVLGNFNNQAVDFQSGALPAHDSVRVSFHIYALDSWDGNQDSDFWGMLIDGSPVVGTSFQNHANGTQCFPDNCPAIHPMGAGSDYGVPGYCHTMAGYRYTITRTFPHIASDIDVSMYGTGLQSICDESWAIDDFRIELYTSHSDLDILWSTGEQGASIAVSPTELTSYSVIITDGLGTCYDTVMVDVNVPEVAFAEDSLYVCGLADLGIGVSGDWAAYQWSDGSQSDSLVVSETGTYFLTVTNELSCQDTDSIHVYFSEVNIMQSDTAVCIGQEVILEASDSSQPLVWSTGEFGGIIALSPASDTAVFLTNPIGIGNCSDSIQIAVSDIQLSALIDHVSCFGLSDGEVSLLVTGGLPPYESDWFGVDPVALAPGTYEFSVTDSIACRLDSAIVVTEPMPLQAIAIPIPPDCVGNQDGGLDFSAFGGTGPYQVDWGSPGPVYPPGVYDYTVTDANNCAFQGTAVMVEGATICGCTYQGACNFDPLAGLDDGSCDYSCYGCTDPLALNFDPVATIDDGSCTVACGALSCGPGTYWDEETGTCLPEDDSCQPDLNEDGVVNTSDLLIFLSVFGLSCVQITGG